VDRDLAEQLARQLGRNPAAALEVHAREEIGLAPGELPNPWVAAGSSLLSFVAGAIIPVVPYLLGATTLIWSLVLSALGLFGAGAVVARVTARPWWFSGLRQLGVGLLAAGVTWGVGTLVGTGLG
jgi:vacuolar iron transporter family protein